jgi:plasmid stabilization system protein ParE
MIIRWTGRALADLQRLHQFLVPVAPDAADNVVRMLINASHRLLEFPRIGSRLERFSPLEVRRIIVGKYELRYVITGKEVNILRIFHSREDRQF